MTAADWKKAALNLALSMGAVMLTAALQAAIAYINAAHPNIYAGVSQTAAAFAAVRFLGR